MGRLEDTTMTTMPYAEHDEDTMLLVLETARRCTRSEAFPEAARLADRDGCPCGVWEDTLGRWTCSTLAPESWTIGPWSLVAVIDPRECEEPM
jgi:hypothetical protein